MNRERLLKCAEAVESVPESQFKMHLWLRKEESCGTVACAIGWYTQKNPGCGLEMKEVSSGRFYPDLYGMEGMAAVALHFDIPKYHAEDIFDTLSYPNDTVTTQEVAGRIRSYVDGKYDPDADDNWDDD